MMPSIDQRLTSMMASIRKVILPAIDPSDALALEQAALLLGHLQMLSAQCDHAVRYEQLELATTLPFADSLHADAEGGEHTLAAAAALCATSIESRKAVAPSRVRFAIGALNDAIERLVSASGEDGSPEFRRTSARLVLAFAGRKALRDRAWFAGSGFEPDAGALPDIPTLMERLEAEIADTLLTGSEQSI